MGYVLKAVLSSAQHPEYGQITVPFPIPDEKYDRMIELLEPLEIGDALRQDCRVDELDSFYTVLNRLVGSLVNFDELDYLHRVAYLEIVTPPAGKVFHNADTDFPVFHIVHHAGVGGTVKKPAAFVIVDVVPDIG